MLNLESSQVITLMSNEVKWLGLWFTFRLRDIPYSSPRYDVETVLLNKLPALAGVYQHEPLPA